MDPPTLGTNPNQSQSRSTTQEANDLTTLRSTRRTVREAGADGPRTPGRRSMTLERTVRKRKQNNQKRTPKCGRSVPYPRTVREQLVPQNFGTSKDPHVNSQELDEHTMNTECADSLWATSRQSASLKQNSPISKTRSQPLLPIHGSPKRLSS
jgi:ribosome assembly protein YihI (activator of Der GTPase)